MNIFTLIGLFVVAKLCIKHRRVFMDKRAFFKAVENLRKDILGRYWNDANKGLDKLVETVMGEGTIMSQEISLEEDVARVIKRIKEAKENESLKEKATTLIDQIKKEL